MLLLINLLVLSKLSCCVFEIFWFFHWRFFESPFILFVYAWPPRSESGILLAPAGSCLFALAPARTRIHMPLYQCLPHTLRILCAYSAHSQVAKFGHQPFFRTLTPNLINSLLISIHFYHQKLEFWVKIRFF